MKTRGTSLVQKKKHKNSSLTDTDELGALVQYPEEGTEATDHLRPSGLRKTKQSHTVNQLMFSHLVMKNTCCKIHVIVVFTSHYGPVGCTGDKGEMTKTDTGEEK